MMVRSCSVRVPTYVVEYLHRIQRDGHLEGGLEEVDGLSLLFLLDEPKYLATRQHVHSSPDQSVAHLRGAEGISFKRTNHVYEL